MHAFYKILNAVGREIHPSNLVKITGVDPVLPTPFRVGELGAAAIAAIGFAISEYWLLKTNRKQEVAISVRDAALAQRSHQYFRLLEGKALDLWDPLSGFYRTKDDRWIQLHCNFPHHRDGVLKALGCSAEKTAVAQAIAHYWDAEALETLLAEQGLCASKVRTANEWAKHPQAHALLKLAPLEIIKVGDSDPELPTDNTRPLSKINVLDLTRVIAGPVCARSLAEHGAQILHITSPKLPSIPPLVMDTGHGKFSAHIDLEQESDREQLKSLIRTADVFSQAYRPGSLAEKGFGLEELKKLRPGIIYAELTAYSHVGPWASRHGYDSLVQSATGIAHEQGANGKPQHLPTQTLDYVAGYLTAFGIIEALRRRAVEGGSYHVRTSLAQIACLLDSLGRVDITEARTKTIPSREEIAPLLTQSKTDFGPIEHMLPVLKLSETPPFWQIKTRPLGTDAPKWLEAASN